MSRNTAYMQYQCILQPARRPKGALKHPGRLVLQLTQPHTAPRIIIAARVMAADHLGPPSGAELQRRGAAGALLGVPGVPWHPGRCSGAGAAAQPAGFGRRFESQKDRGVPAVHRDAAGNHCAVPCQEHIGQLGSTHARQ